MAYEPTTWSTGDVITADKLNKLEQGVQNEQVGPRGEKGNTGEAGPQGATGPAGATGAAGADGKSVTAITLTKDSSGKITGGKATLSDQSTINITVTTAAEG